MTSTKFFIILSAILVVLGSSTTSLKADEISDATNAIREEIKTLESYIEITEHQPEWFEGNAELVNFARETRAKASNLRAVVKALKTATISFGNTGGAQAKSNADATPPTITLNNRLRGGSTAQIAEHLAHEAVHLMNKPVANASIDEEVLCYEKEAEIWSALKKDGDTDRQCNTVLRMTARGGDALRRVVRAAYPHLPEHAPE